MGFQSLNLLFLLSLISSHSLLLLAQQPYQGQLATDCERADNSTSVLGYICNGPNPTCQSYLIFRSLPPYNSVSSISNLLASDPTQLSQINSVPLSATFETDRQVIVPVNCSCSGDYYQTNSSYTIQSGDSYFIVANNTYQGLSTCQALQNQNSVPARSLLPGMNISVPLRCACPTSNQASNGVRYLLTYLVDQGEDVSVISQRFGVNTQSTLDANQLSLENAVLYFFTTLLIPLQNEPSISQTISPPPPPSAPPTPVSSPPSDDSEKTWVYVVIGVAVGAFVLIVSVILFCTFRKRKGRKSVQVIVTKQYQEVEKPIKKLGLPEELLAGISDIDHALKVYKFEELQLATENFSSKCRISGSVYRGVIKGDAAAIKKLNGDVSKEINILQKINHFNLIRLSGVCFSESYWYLVYEYADNGSLSDWIFDESGLKVLSWTQRAQIALDVANGLNYLHSFTEPAYVHKDVKSSNVLLDNDFRAKIANFGMARPTEEQEGGFALTRHIVGTTGYMAPEYLENGLVSPKLDVYALGVMMLELITGKNAIISREQGDMFLSEAFLKVFHDDDAKEKLRDFIDPCLQEHYPFDLALIMTGLINQCLRKDAASRPSMGEIVQSLSTVLATSLTWELSSSTCQFHSSEYSEEV